MGPSLQGEEEEEEGGAEEDGFHLGGGGGIVAGFREVLGLMLLLSYMLQCKKTKLHNEKCTLMSAHICLTYEMGEKAYEKEGMMATEALFFTTLGICVVFSSAKNGLSR